jgi:putative FmdB family regulatory protein
MGVWPVPSYSYRCSECGVFDVLRPMSELVQQETCPRCGLPGRRVFGAPALRSMSPAMRGALDSQHRSAHEPAVVGSVPPSPRRTPVTTDPRHLSLPRP